MAVFEAVRYSCLLVLLITSWNKTSNPRWWLFTIFQQTATPKFHLSVPAFAWDVALLRQVVEVISSRKRYSLAMHESDCTTIKRGPDEFRVFDNDSIRIGKTFLWNWDLLIYHIIIRDLSFWCAERSLVGKKGDKGWFVSFFCYQWTSYPQALPHFENSFATDP